MSRKIRWRAALSVALLSAVAPGAARAAAINHVPVPAGQLQHTVTELSWPLSTNTFQHNRLRDERWMTATAGREIETDVKTGTVKFDCQFRLTVVRCWDAPISRREPRAGTTYIFPGDARLLESWDDVGAGVKDLIGNRAAVEADAQLRAGRDQPRQGRHGAAGGAPALLALVDRDGPHEVHERRTNVRGMLEGIATLPEEQRHALLRREVDGASHADIASELGISGAASRALVHRARDNLVKREEALDAHCCEVQDELLRASRTGRRASAHAYRHLAVCKICRSYRSQLRAMRGALHALHPGGLLFLSVVAAKLGLAGKGALAGAAAKSPAAIGAVAALSAAAAVGGRLVISAGQPSPATIHSPVLPGGVVAKGAPLPRRTVVVVGTAHRSSGSATVSLSCPSGHRVADLLPPGASGVTAGYERGMHPGLSQVATIALSGRRTRGVGVAILCRVPGPDGALTPAFNAQARGASMTAPRPPAVACVDRGYLRGSPAGDVTGSIGSGEPLRVLQRTKGWRRVATEFGAIGWVAAMDLCG
jgi:hypothetical protein